jgi:hypothetical protein
MSYCSFFLDEKRTKKIKASAFSGNRRYGQYPALKLASGSNSNALRHFTEKPYLFIDLRSDSYS